MDKAIIAILGQDRPGIVAAVSKSLFEQDCNIENVSQITLQFVFAGIFIISMPTDLSTESLHQNLAAALTPLGLEVHITLFETWEPKFDDIIKGVKSFKIKKLGCNHCTGWIWAEKAAAAGVPVVKGTNKYKEYKRTSTVATASNVFLTNGDHVVF